MASNEPTDSELMALASKLTIDEKVLLLAGKNVWETHAIDRLDIPSAKVSSASQLPAHRRFRS